jgi:hypothetical protein
VRTPQASEQHCLVVLAGLDARGGIGQERHHLTDLIIVKHWHFGLAAPTPEHFHRGLFDFTSLALNEFYKKGCQEKTPPRPEWRFFLEIQPTVVSLLWRSWLVIHAHEFLCCW